jgi:hypothetical protein
MGNKPNINVFDIVLAVCEERDSLCMDVPGERRRLASAITAALQRANVLAHRGEQRMPICKNCQHPGGDHNWKVRRVRGQCMYPHCDCGKYVPLTDRPKPVNRVMGRALY